MHQCVLAVCRRKELFPTLSFTLIVQPFSISLIRSLLRCSVRVLSLCSRALIRPCLLCIWDSFVCFFLFCFFCPLFCFFCIFMMFYACVFLLCVYVLNIDALSEPHLHRSERHSFLTDSQCDTFKIISASRLRRVSQTQPRTRTRA